MMFYLTEVEGTVGWECLQSQPVLSLNIEILKSKFEVGMGI